MSLWATGLPGKPGDRGVEARTLSCSRLCDGGLRPGRSGYRSPESGQEEAGRSPSCAVPWSRGRPHAVLPVGAQGEGPGLWP